MLVPSSALSLGIQIELLLTNHPIPLMLLLLLINWVFCCLCSRIAHGESRRILQFRSLSSSSSDEVSDMRQEFITRTEFVDDEADIEEKDDLKSRIFRVRLPKRSVTNVLQRWVGEGNQITISDLRTISKDLRKSHRYKHAFEVHCVLYSV